MSGPTALTASVWGQGRAAIHLSNQAAALVNDADEECMICRDDVPATIAFVPCSHRVCFACVENMRAKNIFKADKGVKCPFCRTYVDGYKTLLPPSGEVQRFLQEANKAAGIAAAARLNEQRKAQGMALAAARPNIVAPPPVFPVAPSSSSSSSTSGATGSAGAAGNSSEDVMWNCAACGCCNYAWKDFCNRCRRPNPSPMSAQPNLQSRKDVLSASRDELISMMHEKGAFVLGRTLLDMGVTISTTQAQGSTNSVRDALAAHPTGLRRLSAVVEVLQDPTVMREVSLHAMGNFAVQRLLEASSKLRAAARAGPLQPYEQFKITHGGKDYFSLLLAAVQPHMLEYCLHDKGCYVVQCAFSLCSNPELVLMARSMFPAAVPISRDSRGIFCLINMLDLFGQRIWDDPSNCEPGLAAVDQLCECFLANDGKLLNTAHHAMSGKMLVRAIAVALPRMPALKVASRIASLAAPLSASQGGPVTLMELLALYGHNAENCLVLRDVFCNMAMALQGHVGALALSDDENQHQVLWMLIDRLAGEQEVEWLDSIIQELVGVVDALVNKPDALELLLLALSKNILDLEEVTDHVKQIKMVLGKESVTPLVATLMERIGANEEPPAPKYTCSSVIQPELKYYLARGVPIPLRPAPPKGPKPSPPPAPAANPQQQPQQAATPAAAAPTNGQASLPPRPAAATPAAPPPAAVAAVNAWQSSNSSSAAGASQEDSWADANNNLSWADPTPSLVTGAVPLNDLVLEQATGAVAESSSGDTASEDRPAAAAATEESSWGDSSAAGGASSSGHAGWGEIPGSPPPSGAVEEVIVWNAGDRGEPRPASSSTPVEAAGAGSAGCGAALSVPVPVPLPLPKPAEAGAAAGGGGGPRIPVPVPTPTPAAAGGPRPVAVPMPLPVPVPSAAAAAAGPRVPFPVPVPLPVAAGGRGPGGVPMPVFGPTATAANPLLQERQVIAIAPPDFHRSPRGPVEDRNDGQRGGSAAAGGTPWEQQNGQRGGSWGQQEAPSAMDVAWPQPQQAAAVANNNSGRGGRGQGGGGGGGRSGSRSGSWNAIANVEGVPVELEPARPWSCAVCTFNHEGPEAEFLQCAMCGTQKAGT